MRIVWPVMVVGGPLAGERVVGGRMRGVLGVSGVLERMRAGVGAGGKGKGRGGTVSVVCWGRGE